MKVLKMTAVVAVVAGLAVQAPSVHGQSNDSGQDRSRGRDLTILGGQGGELGVRIADADSGGVEIQDVQPGSAADKAGLKAGDVIVEFDSERVRGSRQFARLVRETPTGRSVKATIVRAGKRQDVEMTTSELRESRAIIGGGRLLDRDSLRDLAGRLPE